MKIDVESFAESLCDTMAGVPYCELAVLLASTNALALLYQTQHWKSSGQSQYGDHLLFQRLYEQTSLESDGIAEKIVGLSSEDLVDASLLSSMTDKFLLSVYVPAKDAASTSLAAEIKHVALLEHFSKLLDNEGLLTYGVDNMLGELADKHEENVYLLKMRST